MAEVPEHLLRALAGAPQGARSPRPRRGGRRGDAAAADGARGAAVATAPAADGGGGGGGTPPARGDAVRRRGRRRRRAAPRSRRTCSSGRSAGGPRLAGGDAGAARRGRRRWRRQPRRRSRRRRHPTATGPGRSHPAAADGRQVGIDPADPRRGARTRCTSGRTSLVIEFASILILLGRGHDLLGARARAAAQRSPTSTRRRTRRRRPWYFLGLQELLTMFHPMVAGVTIPGVGLGLLVVAPLHRQEPVAQPNDRKFAIADLHACSS